MSLGSPVAHDAAESRLGPVYDFCPCESSYCTQHGGRIETRNDWGERVRVPMCDPCPNKPEGHFTMDFLGWVCDACAAVNSDYCHAVV